MKLDRTARKGLMIAGAISISFLALPYFFGSTELRDMTTATVPAVIAGVIAAIHAVRKSQPTMANRLDLIQRSLRASSKVLNELEREVADRMTVLERRQGEVRDLERVSDPEQRAALERILRRQNVSSVRQFWLGIGLGAILGFAVNLGSSWVWDALHR